VQNIGNYPSDARIGLRPDTVSSLELGREVQVQLCKDALYRGDCERFTGGERTMDDTRIGHDTVSSMKVQTAGTRECLPGASEAALFMHTDHLSPCVVKGVGKYANAHQIGLDDDSISSIRVGSAVQVCACVDDDFGEHCETFTKNVGTLENSFTGYASGHDIISSVKVQPRGEVCKAAPPPRRGYSAITVTNCSNDQHTMFAWLRDLTVAGPWVNRGTLVSQWSPQNGCRAGAPLTIPLTDAHEYQFVVVDPQLLACSEPHPAYGACLKLEVLQAFPGLTTGPVYPITVY
jgi:hypothetical protein